MVHYSCLLRGLADCGVVHCAADTCTLEHVVLCTSSILLHCVCYVCTLNASMHACVRAMPHHFTFVTAVTPSLHAGCKVVVQWYAPGSVYEERSHIIEANPVGILASSPGKSSDQDVTCPPRAILDFVTKSGALDVILPRGREAADISAYTSIRCFRHQRETHHTTLRLEPIRKRERSE